MKRAYWQSVILCLLVTFGVSAEDSAEDSPDEGETEEEKKPTIVEITEDSDRIDGLFTLFRDRNTGELRLLLEEEQLGRRYIYFGYVEDGVAAAWQFRGRFRDTKVFHLDRYFDRIEFIVENSSYLFDENKAISRAAGANISHAVLGDFKIEAEDEETGECLISVSEFFLGDNLTPVVDLPDPKAKPHEVFGVGTLSAERSKIRDIRNYPANTDVIVEYVFQNDKPYVSGGESVTDPRAVSLRLQHSFIEAPANDFEQRYDDPRVGYFIERGTDLSSTEVIPYRDRIARWHLVKKNPDRALSEPVEPLVFWIENTTPVELRDIVEKAGRRWNEAFRSAGFKNALDIKIQPDDADWDAGDLRYNVIRWVSSPQPLFGGYGPSFVDPRTGQILGADIILEHVVISNFLRQYRVFGTGFEEALADPRMCLAADLAHEEMIFGRAALKSLGAESKEQERLLEEFMYFLVLHEIGHTLGLSHNFRASHLHSLEDLFTPDRTYETGLLASVMDYPHTPFVTKGTKQGQFWTTRPGPYDHWAIEYGYSPAGDLADEAERLGAILARSTEPALAFGNDADDMRSPGKAIDPRAQINDMSSDPIGFAELQIAVVESVLPELGRRLTVEGASYQDVVNGFYTAIRHYRSSVRTVSRFIGGVYVDRAMVGQPGAQMPLRHVELATQQRAMAVLAKDVFAPDALTYLQAAAGTLLAQRRGWDHRSGTEDPKLHNLILGEQRRVLDHLLHPRVLLRLSDTGAYGNEYSPADMLTDLTAAVFEADLAGGVNGYRQNLQTEYVQRLLKITAEGSEYDYRSQSLALNRLRWVEGQLAAAGNAGLSTNAHRQSIVYRIQRGLDFAPSHAPTPR
jgi:hypothetical protein